MVICLRPITEADLQTLAQFLCDEDAIFMAGAGSGSTDVSTHIQHFKKLMEDESISMAVIISGASVVGYIAAFMRGDEREITYWIGREYWGQGIASKAVKLFLPSLQEKYVGEQIFARVVKGNKASEHVLLKAGFKATQTDKFYSDIRSTEVTETIFCI